MAWHRPRRLCARREAKHRRQGGQALTPNTLRAGAHPKARQAGAHPGYPALTRGVRRSRDSSQRAPSGITRGRTARETVGASSTNAGARSGLGGVIARIPDHPSRIPGRQADTLRAQALTRDVRKPRESSQRPPPGYPAGRRTPCVPGAHPGRAETPGVEPADTPGITGAGDCPRDGGAVCADTLGAQSGLGGGIASGCW